jgi:hypothetical protein
MVPPNEPIDTPADGGEPETPDAFKAMLELAKAGDLAGLLDAIIKSPPSAADLRKVDVLIRGAVKSASKKSPRNFTRAVFRETLALVAYVQSRMHVYAVRGLANSDRAVQQPLQPLSDELDKILPQIERLARLVQELSQGWAATSRQWELARQARRRASGRRPPPRSLNDSYRRLVEDGELPAIQTCEVDTEYCQ